MSNFTTASGAKASSPRTQPSPASPKTQMSSTPPSRGAQKVAAPTRRCYCQPGYECSDQPRPTFTAGTVYCATLMQEANQF